MTAKIQPARVTPQHLAQVQALDAQHPGQSELGEALAWVLRDPVVRTALIGASRPEQIEDAVGALAAGPLSMDELAAIEAILVGEG